MVPCPGGGGVGRGAAMVAVCLAGGGIVPDAGTESVAGRCGENLISRPVTDPSMGRGDNEPSGGVRSA